MTDALNVAVIGGGWAGMAAAVTLAQSGAKVTVYEAARQPGGRARSLDLSWPANSAEAGNTAGTAEQTTEADNGQHILIGAYAECLRLMQTVGVDIEQALLRKPMTLRYADGSGLQLPSWPAPLDAVAGIATAKGWSLGERLALLARATRWRLQGFVCAEDATVAQLCQGLPQRLMDEFIEPLCISALNLPATQASGTVFLRVLQDALFAGTGGSHFLVPRASLGALFPQAAMSWLTEQGHEVRCASRVLELISQGLQWSLRIVGDTRSNTGTSTSTNVGTNTATNTGSNDSPGNSQHLPRYDAVILACTPQEAARLSLTVGEDESMSAHDSIALANWSALALELEHTAIATVYARTQQPGQRLTAELPWLALRSGPGRPAQFVFDRGHLTGTAQDQGLMAFVISHSTLGREYLQQQVLAQAASELGWTDMQAVKTVIEKRATFACTPALQRPGMEMCDGLWACGDYIDGPYPATLEGAVRSGVAAALAVTQAALES